MTFITPKDRWEETRYSAKTASVAIQPYSFLKYDGSGGVEPATGGNSISICGIATEPVLATDSDYSGTRQVPYMTVLDRLLLIPIGAGTATAAMVGNTYNLHDAVSLDVSGAGYQVVVTKFISTTLVEGKVVLVS